MSDEDGNNGFEAPETRRARLEAGRDKMAGMYDRAVWTLSAGAFFLSLLFYDRIAASPVQARCLLVGAWIAFGMSILSVLWSFFWSERAQRLELDQMDSREPPDPRWEARLA